MDKSSDVASAVISEQLGRMLKQEKEELGLLLVPVFGRDLPPLIKDQVLGVVLRMVVMMKISVIARLN